jgi:hypothetical protein
MEDKYYKKYLKYKNKYTALKNAFSNDMYAQLGGTGGIFDIPKPTLRATRGQPASPTASPTAKPPPPAPASGSLTPDQAAAERLKSRHHYEDIDIDMAKKKQEEMAELTPASKAVMKPVSLYEQSYPLKNK